MNEAYITSWAAIVDPPKMDESPKAIRFYIVSKIKMTD